MNKKNAFVISVIVFVLVFILSKFSEGTPVYEFRANHSSSIISPLEFISLFLTITTFLLLFFSQKIFQVWLNKFMIWFFPLSVLVIASGTTEVSFGWSTRTDLAISMGSIMVAVTLVLALIQRFYYGIK